MRKIILIGILLLFLTGCIQNKEPLRESEFTSPDCTEYEQELYSEAVMNNLAEHGCRLEGKDTTKLNFVEDVMIEGKITPVWKSIEVNCSLLKEDENNR